MTTSRWIRRTSGALLAFAVAAAGLTGAGIASPAHAAAPGPTDTATTGRFDLRFSGGGLGAQAQVTVEPATGRIELAPYYWRVRDQGPQAPGVGSFLNVSIGTQDGERCLASISVSLDMRTVTVDRVRVVAGGSSELAAFSQIPVEDAWEHTVARLEIAPFGAMDCVYASGEDSYLGDPHGTRIVSSETVGLRTVAFGDRTDGYPASVDCPDRVAYDQPFALPVGHSASPGTYEPAGVVPVPSHLENLGFTIDDASGATVDSTPTPPSDIDLWTDDPWTGAFALTARADEVDRVRLEGTITTGDAVTRWVCVIGVSMPAPTDWEGDLTGTTWWQRSSGSNSGIGPYRKHYAYEFLDEEWVFVTSEYVRARTAPCTRVAVDLPLGCHRYYYDAERQLLQIDDRRAKRTEGGWELPAFGGRYSGYDETHVVRPVVRGMKVHYTGTGRAGLRLTLRPDGTYALRRNRKATTTSGRYRLLPASQELLLRRKGADLRLEVALFYGVREGKVRLFDIDTSDRHLRVRRW